MDEFGADFTPDMGIEGVDLGGMALEADLSMPFSDVQIDAGSFGANVHGVNEMANTLLRTGSAALGQIPGVGGMLRQLLPGGGMTTATGSPAPAANVPHPKNGIMAEIAQHPGKVVVVLALLIVTGIALSK